MKNNSFTGKPYLFINLVMLSSSVIFCFIVVFAWGVLDYLLIAVFSLSSLLTFVYFHSLKILIERKLRVGVSEGLPEENKQTSLALFLAILLTIVIPVIIMLVIPYIGLFVINGIICGASISNLVFFFTTSKKERKKEGKNIV